MRLSHLYVLLIVGGAFADVLNPFPTNTDDCRMQANQVHYSNYFKFICPPGCRRATNRLWGSRIYKNDSYICAAAIHDGVIQDSGGVVTVHLLDGLQSYVGSRQNEITSESFESGTGSFSFGGLSWEIADICQNQANKLKFYGMSSISWACPSGCQETASLVWGTGIYKDDSYICAAAIHDGRITDTGGSFTIYILDGLQSYKGSEQNGISSKSFGVWFRSFSFENFCEKQASQLDFNGQESTTFYCPPGCQTTTLRLWGTRIYTDGSYICAAGIHDGEITDSGGLVTVYLLSGLYSYTGTTQKGITSNSYRYWRRSFTFTDLCRKQASQLDFNGLDNMYFTCPSGCQATSSHVWGTEIYTDTSYICAAAIHAGRLTDSGGRVIVYTYGGVFSYTGSDENGILSKSHGNHSGSFAFESLCEKNVFSLEFNGSQPATFLCPPGCESFTFSLWGTEIYSGRSHICAAALHSGIITDHGGLVTVYQMPGMSSYFRSTQNGITSRWYGSYSTSFTFSRFGPCTRSANALEFSGHDTGYACPSGCADSSHLWGTTLYTDNSYICAAAVHAGRIDDSGGSFTIYKYNGLESYTGSDQNGVISQPFGSWNGSFAFENLCSKLPRNLIWDEDNTASIYCPPGCLEDATIVYGTGIYSFESKICPAALHDGAVTDAGGLVTVYKLTGLPFYTGSSQNEVTSWSYRAWDRSFVVSDPCLKLVNQLEFGGQRSAAYACRAGCLSAAYQVWGTEFYSNNSSVCAAAIHAGIITDSGGNVTVYKYHELNSLNGSDQNGVLSKSLESLSESITFLDLCKKQASQLFSNSHESASFYCPPGCQTVYSKLWGNRIYTLPSYVCAAAIHDDVLTDAGGSVTIYLVPRQNWYSSVRKNGVTSRSDRTWQRGFAFSDLCRANYSQVRHNNRNGVKFLSFICPTGCDAVTSHLWGTDIYTHDSYICAAALHAGSLTVRGGYVVVHRHPEHSGFIGSERNGIVSQSYENFTRSYAFQNYCLRIGSRLTYNQNGTATYNCPSGCKKTKQWFSGYGIYSANSIVCASAIHDGTMTDDGGLITIYRLPGQRSYIGSEHNGLTSKQSRHSRMSFAFSDPCTRQAKQLDFGEEMFTSFPCPASCNVTSARVRGTIIYTDDSSICAAAIHDGRITDSGGIVTVYKYDGLSSYTGTEQNGVVSESFGRWTGSFALENLCEKQTNQIEFRGQESTTMYCPSGCQNTTERLWGTGIYTDRSYICAAAIHDGAITDFGGVVTLYRGGSMWAYFNSTQNGITSKSYTWWYGSVSFTDLCGKQGDQLEFNGQNAKSFTCPPNCQETSTGVWGTRIYTKNSHICAAAVHDGSISDSGGRLTVYKTAGLPSYTGSEQNGITSQTFGSWRESITFTNPCTRQADHLDFNGMESAFFPCPPGCQDTTARLWGTDIYTDDSYICAAAIHSSQIIGSEGGLVQVMMRGSQNTFTSSTRQGITSKFYGAWPRSFSLLGN